MKPRKFESIKHFFWDPRSKTCMGRTGESWAKLIAFYIVFYSCLVAFWSLLVHFLHMTISEKYPKYQLDESLIGTNPGLALRPRSPRDRIESALISYEIGPNGDFKHWSDDIENFLKEETAANINNNSNNNEGVKHDCNSNKDPKDIDSYCPFDNSSIPIECSASQNFSFPVGKPCILLKLNRIYGWKPIPWSEKPPNYPDGAPFEPGNVQITCEGQHDPDKEHIGHINYYPSAGISTKYYPFTNQAGYQSPYVMVQFERPKLNTLIYIECKAWAQNVQHDRYNRRGMISFELFLENNEHRNHSSTGSK